MEPDFDRRWRYEPREAHKVVDTAELGANEEALRWGGLRLRDLGLHEADL